MSLLNSKIADYGDSVTLEDIGYPSSMLYDNSIVSTCRPLKLRFVLAMVGVVARVVIKVKIDITNGFGIWLF
jgi:hypothetical protein